MQGFFKKKLTWVCFAKLLWEVPYPGDVILRTVGAIVALCHELRKDGDIHSCAIGRKLANNTSCKVSFDECTNSMGNAVAQLLPGRRVSSRRDLQPHPPPPPPLPPLSTRRLLPSVGTWSRGGNGGSIGTTCYGRSWSPLVSRQQQLGTVRRRS